MKKIFAIILLAFALVPSAHAQRANVNDPNAKFNFKKGELHIAGKTVAIEIADTSELRERGLMFRKSLPKDGGMLFIFDDAEIRQFWMMNTLIPLSIGFFDVNKKLVKALEMEPAVMGERSPPIYSSEKSAQYALEMPKDWFPQNHIKPGTAFTYTAK
jgi:uncharacterized membrane protein (UPF0127 family)